MCREIGQREAACGSDDKPLLTGRVDPLHNLSQGRIGQGSTIQNRHRGDTPLCQPSEGRVPRQAPVSAVPDREGQKVPRQSVIEHGMPRIQVLAANSPPRRNAVGDTGVPPGQPRPRRMIAAVQRPRVVSVAIKRGVLAIHLFRNNHVLTDQTGQVRSHLVIRPHAGGPWVVRCARVFAPVRSGGHFRTLGFFGFGSGTSRAAARRAAMAGSGSSSASRAARWGFAPG